LLGTAELHLQKAILKFVHRGDTVYDVGANLGYVALSLSKQVGPHGRVAAFEPVPQNLRLLRENIEDNQLANIEVFDAAASDKDGEALIRIPENLSMASLIWHTENPACIQHATRTVAIDDLVQAGRLACPTFVKIDVEGAEALVLRGMRRTIVRAQPVMFVECSDSGREETWRLLSDCGYVCRSAVTGQRVLSFDEYRHSDFLWIPSGQSGV
jgi:FkbM family methyltransferase